MNVSNASQTAHFDDLSQQWWNEYGAFGVLHAMNPARIKFIKDLVTTYSSLHGLQNLNALDVGCGGGIVCEPLARLGAKVTGIDASNAAIKAAQEHAHQQNLMIDYKCMDIKNIAETFDLVTCLEVVEHVDDLNTFANDLSQKVKPGGVLVLSTLNRTWFSYMVGIIGAEYLARKVPTGTHDWHKFIEPSQLVDLFETKGMRAVLLTGLNYSIFKREWELSGKLQMNYLAGFVKFS
jgi:2-polyprenyl-6-hydroxyphenyl methylase / 3-demethylubiquinone-9 3-methyltransferase